MNSRCFQSVCFVSKYRCSKSLSLTLSPSLSANNTIVLFGTQHHSTRNNLYGTVKKIISLLITPLILESSVHIHSTGVWMNNLGVKIISVLRASCALRKISYTLAFTQLWDGEGRVRISLVLALRSIPLALYLHRNAGTAEWQPIRMASEDVLDERHSSKVWSSRMVRA